MAITDHSQSQRKIHQQLCQACQPRHQLLRRGHPSLTNYLETVGGSNFGIRSDNPPDWGNTACSPNIATGIPTPTTAAATPPSPSTPAISAPSAAPAPTQRLPPSIPGMKSVAPLSLSPTSTESSPCPLPPPWARPSAISSTPPASAGNPTRKASPSAPLLASTTATAR